MVPAIDSMAENNTGSRLVWHITAFVVSVIWGATFVSTKTLINAGLTPAVIFAQRFALAYLSLLPFCHKRLFCRTLRHEVCMILLGITGGSLYFLAENMALEHTMATNVSMIVCSCPLFTTVMVCAVMRQRLNARQWTGTLLALAGMVAVVLNGRIVLHLSPLGDILAFAACLMWTFYSLILKAVDRYEAMFVCRKVFFYGLLTIIPYLLFFDNFPLASLPTLCDHIVVANLLFLGFVASTLCFLLWTVCVKRLGTIETTNYVYVNPMSTACLAYLVLDERITLGFALGACMIMVGLWLANRH